MTLTRRETRLALMTLAIVLVGLTFWVGEPKYEEWKRLSTEAEALHQRRVIAERLMSQKPELDSRLEVLRETLPAHPAELDVTSQILRNLQRTADEHGLTLLRREPDRERPIGDLYELAVTCTWEGELRALVHFLYALQSQGAIVDVRQLTIAPVQGAPNRLRGNLTVDYAYSRVAPGGA